MMTNHPTRSQKSQDAAIRRLIIKHQLSQVNIIMDSHTVGAQAHPANYNPIVGERRQALLGSRDWSMGELEGLREQTMRPIAHASGKTIEEAIHQLAAELGRAPVHA